MSSIARPLSKLAHFVYSGIGGDDIGHEEHKTLIPTDGPVFALPHPRFHFLTIAYPSTVTMDQWRMGGENLSNTRSQPSESAIGPSNVSQLVVKWVFATGG
jgi:hypothetical protein